MAEDLRKTYATPLDEFCQFAKCDLAEFEMFCSLFAKEIEDCDGLASRDFHVLMGMKIPFRLDDKIVSNYKNQRQPTYNLGNVVTLIVHSLRTNGDFRANVMRIENLYLQIRLEITHWREIRVPRPHQYPRSISYG